MCAIGRAIGRSRGFSELSYMSGRMLLTCCVGYYRGGGRASDPVRELLGPRVFGSVTSWARVAPSNFRRPGD